MSNSLRFDLFESASSDRNGDRSVAIASSTALLALRRWARRSLKQMGAGLLSLLLVWGAIAHDAQSLDSTNRPSISLHRDQPAVVQVELTEGDKPFQALRPKMTYHRLTTSRLSIPVADARTIASLSSRKLGRELDRELGRKLGRELDRELDSAAK